MAARGLGGIPHAQPTRSAHPNDVACDAWLRNEVLKRQVQIANRGLPLQFAAAFAMAAAIDGERVDSGGSQLLGQALPRRACAVALMEQQHSGAWLCRGKVSGLQDDSVRSFQIDDSCVRRRLSQELPATNNE